MYRNLNQFVVGGASIDYLKSRRGAVVNQFQEEMEALKEEGASETFIKQCNASFATSIYTEREINKAKNITEHLMKQKATRERLRQKLEERKLK
jgi:hypothetical protein